MSRSITQVEDDAAGPVEAWLEEIAGASQQPVEVVREVLAEHGVRAQTALPRPHRILVTAVEFDGIRPAPDGQQHDAADIPFRFHWEPGPGVWCLASTGKNEAGKSSVLEIILWCLRGRAGLQRDVRSWLRRVRTEFVLDDEPLVVEMTVTGGIPTGSVVSKQTGAELASFDGMKAFEESMDAFMLDRLGLEPLRTQQKPRGDVEALPVTGELSWPSYASGLHINRKGLGHLLGNESRNALPTRLLELFLGAPWAATMVAASVAQKVVAAQLSAARQRAAADAQARRAQLGELTRQLETERARLAALPEQGQAAADLSAAYRTLAAATATAGEAQRALAAARLRHDTLEEQRHSLAQAVQTAQEAALAQAFFHTLMPTVCPRCDTKVSKEQWAREREGHCSLCTSRLPEPTDHDHDAHGDEETETADDLRRALAGIQQEAEEAAGFLATAQVQALAAADAVTRAEAALQEALKDPGTSERRAVELAVARLEGAVAERTGRFADLDAAVDITPLEVANTVLKAAEKAAHARRTAALKQVLKDVEKDIVTMGRALGLEMLQRVELGTGATLTVWKGGQQHTYGSLTEGEQLRLKIVTTTALLRHGIRSGVGRHPGLLIVDSPGAEEVDSKDLRLMVQDLVKLTDMAPELQVIIATARGEDVASLIPEGQLRLAPPGARLW
ncbi:hypothetical protein [Streptomyces pseudogriseolus]|uniref:hypothetical protein n=1 Tax=Streptomyces pseudogriseolus TaxID=36817 RepID=UPI003FA1DA8F